MSGIRNIQFGLLYLQCLQIFSNLFLWIGFLCWLAWDPPVKLCSGLFCLDIYCCWTLAILILCMRIWVWRINSIFLIMGFTSAWSYMEEAWKKKVFLGHMLLAVTRKLNSPGLMCSSGILLCLRCGNGISTITCNGCHLLSRWSQSISTGQLRIWGYIPHPDLPRLCMIMFCDEPSSHKQANLHLKQTIAIPSNTDIFMTCNQQCHDILQWLETNMFT